MTATIADFLKNLTWREGITAAIDIIIVAVVIYRVLVMVKGTRSAQMLIGLVLIGVGFFLAKQFELTMLTWLLDGVINSAIIFLIIIFQHDIRRGLTRVGQNLFGTRTQYEETFVFEEIIKAAEQLARSSMGGLIVIEREADLEEFFGDPGVIVDGRVTKEALVACFIPQPENTMHDGAVVIKNLRLHRAGCVLPLSANPKLDKELGTRHRAAIGITEETDAVVVVISEERGQVSLCFGGNIARNLDAPTLRKAILGLFQKPKRDAARADGKGLVRSDPMATTQRITIPGVVAETLDGGSRRERSTSDRTAVAGRSERQTGERRAEPPEEEAVPEEEPKTLASEAAAMARSGGDEEPGG